MINFIEVFYVFLDYVPTCTGSNRTNTDQIMYDMPAQF
jgi:hypothetical protein